MKWDNPSLRATVLHAFLLLSLLLQVMLFVPPLAVLYDDRSVFPGVTDWVIRLCCGTSRFAGVVLLVAVAALWVDFRIHAFLTRRAGEAQAWAWSAAAVILITALQFCLWWALMLPLMTMRQIVSG